MLRKLLTFKLLEPSTDETDLLLRDTLLMLRDQNPPAGGWEHLRARISAGQVEEERTLHTVSLNQRRLPFIGMSYLWEPLMRPQAWSRLTI